MVPVLELLTDAVEPAAIAQAGVEGGDRVEQFLQSKALALKSQREYRRELKRFARWSGKDWEHVTGQDVAAFKGWLHEQGLSKASVAQAIAALKSFFTWLVAAQLLAENPTLAVRIPTPTPPPALHFTEEQMQALWAALEFRTRTYCRDRAIVAVLEHGLRVGEVCGLDVADFDGQRVLIRQAKHDSVGQVPLLSEAVRAIEDYLEERRKQGENVEPESPLFVSRSLNSLGKRLGYRGIYDLVKDLGQVAGVEDCHPHRFRHTFATRLVLKGVDSYLARKLTRHESEGAFRRYSEQARQQAAEDQFRKLFED
jgi:integrase/recombinase XerD